MLELRYFCLANKLRDKYAKNIDNFCRAIMLLQDIFAGVGVITGDLSSSRKVHGK